MATDSDNVNGTLHDQRIFGPIHDLECACGKYVGDQYRNIVCDVCGVKVAFAEVRGLRFGHIPFAEPMSHPFAEEMMLHCWPVVPMRYAQSQGGQMLLDLYDHLIEAATTNSITESCQIMAFITDLLLPVTLTLHAWDVAAASILAQGMALKRIY